MTEAIEKMCPTMKTENYIVVKQETCKKMIIISSHKILNIALHKAGMLEDSSSCQYYFVRAA